MTGVARFVVRVISVGIITMTGSLTVAAEKWPRQSVIKTTDARDLALIRALDEYIAALVRAREVPGLNIALARGERIVWEGAYGYADAKARRPTTAETVFHSGSIAKIYSAVAIMQLAERGSLKLDDPINKYLPFEVRNPLGGPAITIRHLLTHSSGLSGDAASSYLCDDPRTVRPLAEFVREAYEKPREHGWGAERWPKWSHPAGTKYIYSNLGVATLGLVVEGANPERLSYSEYVQKEIMDRLGMRYAQMPPGQTRKLVRPDIWARLSTGYQPLGGAWIPTARVCFGEFPCGGSLATPADFLRLMMALGNGGKLDGTRLLGAESVKAMLTPQSLEPTKGLILLLDNWSEKTTRAFQHSGGHMFGWHTFAIAYPDSKLAFVAGENQWSSLEGWGGAMPELRAFVDAWLKAEAAGGPAPDFVTAQLRAMKQPLLRKPPAVENLAWKLSYLRGVLFAEGYPVGILTPQRLTEREAREYAEETETRLSAVQPAHWDGDAFVAGIRDMATVPPTIEGVRDFATSRRMRISLEEARQLFPLLRLFPGDPEAGVYASLGGLLIEGAAVETGATRR